jgi:hypothetical protein
MANYDFDWIKSPKGRDWYWFERIFRELSHYYDSYIEDVAEIPFNYTERAFVGSLAIAAHKCGYYTLQEYASKCEEEEQCRFPDFWITLEPQKNSYDVVFEIKKKKATFDTIEDQCKEEISEGIREANEYLGHYKIGKREEARFQCALVAIQIRCDEKQWKRINNGESYNKRIGTLKKLKNKIEKLSKKEAALLDDGGHSFWYLYWLPFERINNKEFKQYYWSEKKSRNRYPYTKPALALLVYGSFKPVSRTTA